MKLSVAAYRAIADTANKRLTRGWQRRRSTYGSIGDSPQQQEQELVNTGGAGGCGHHQTFSSSSSSCSSFNHDDDEEDRDHVRRPTRSDTTSESQRRPEEVATQSTDDEDDEVCPADPADTSPRHPLPSHGLSLAASAVTTTTTTTPLARGSEVPTTAATAKAPPPPAPDVKSLSPPPPPIIPPPPVNRPTSTVNRFLPSRSRGTQRWMKLRTTVQLTGAVTSAVREKKPPLKREDSFLKRFSTRQTADFSDDDYDGPGSDYYSSGQSGGGHWGGKGGGGGGGGGRGMRGVGGEGGTPGLSGRTMSVDHRIALHRRRRKHARRMRSTVINPDENFYFWWLTVITACVLYNCWTLIVRQAFPELQQGVAILWNSLDATCDLLLVADVAVQFRTGYLEQGLIVYDSRKLAAHYVRSRPFLLDVLTMFPLDLLRVWIERPAPLLRFPRFIKVYRSCMYFRIVESRTLYPNVWRVVNLVHILLLLAHWFGCFYYLLSEAEGFVGDWVYPKPDGDYGTLTRKYLGSLYWSTLTLTTIGDLATPETNWQYLFTIVSYLIGVFIFATIVGQVGNVITNRNANRLEFERLLDGAKLYMRHHKVPRDMQRRVQRWYDYTWSRGRMHAGGDINTALGILPDKLKTELALHVNLTTLKKVTIFQECQPEFLHDLVLKMKAFIFTPGDLICRKGEVAREMFIIADGILEVISETGKVLTTMKAGDFFGEIGILNLDGLNRRTADVRSVGYAELFSLSREDVLSAMKDYPEAQEILQTMGKKRLMEARKAAVNAKKELTAAAMAASAMAASEATSGTPEGTAAATGSTPGSAGVQTGPDSDSARQKAVLMVRRLRRDAKDLRNYLMKGSTKRGSSLFRSKDEETACVGKADDVRIEMETVQTRPAAERRMTRDRLKSSSSQEDPQDEGDSPDKTTVRSGGGGGGQQEAGRATSSFLQRVLALRQDKSLKKVDSETQHAASGCGGVGDVTIVAPSKPSVSFAGDDITKRPAHANANRGGQLWKTVKDSMLTSKVSGSRELPGHDSNTSDVINKLAERRSSGCIQETDKETLVDTSATSVQAWSATFHPHDPRIQTLTSNSLGFSAAPAADDESRRMAIGSVSNVNGSSHSPSTMTEARTPTTSDTHLPPLPLVTPPPPPPPRVKSILKHHLSRSESDVSGLLFSLVSQKQQMSSSTTNAAVKKARLAKTVSFRDQVKALQSSTGQVGSTFGQDECVADLLLGIKQVLQIRMDEVQSQFKSRLVALEVAMQEKEGHIHQLQTKLFEMEVREEANRCYESVMDGRTGADAALISSPQNALTSLDEDPTYLTHPGYVCHPRRSWPMLASRQRRVVSYHRHSSVDELLQLEHHYRTRCPSLKEICSTTVRTSDSEGEPTSDLMFSPDDDPEYEDEDEEEEDDYEDTEDLRMEQSDSESENTVAWIDGHTVADDGFVIDNNDWEIQMLAQEMIKQEAKTKDLPDVVEEEDDDDEYEYGMCLSSSSRRATVGETSTTTPLPYRRRLSRKLRRQQSWAGEPERLLHDSSTISSSATAAATAMPPPLPRRLESMPVVEDNKIIEQFVHSTLRRLDKLEKVFTGVSETTQPSPAPPVVAAAGAASGRRKALSTLRAQRSLDLQLEDRVIDESPEQQRRHRTLNRYASFGDGLSSNLPPPPPSPSLSQLNIPMRSIGMTASFGSPSSSSQPPQPQQQHQQRIITSPTYNRNRPTTVAALQVQLEEPSSHAAVGLQQYRNVRDESLPRELDNNRTQGPPSSSEDVDADLRPLLAPLTSSATLTDQQK